VPIPGSGFVGGVVGGVLGGLFDPPGAGELNYKEPLPPKPINPTPMSCHSNTSTGPVISNLR
jgi:hypothetical protein